MKRLIFNNIKKRILKISDTEKIALNCGTTSIDRELFEGKVKKHKFSIDDTILDLCLQNKTDNLLKKNILMNLDKLDKKSNEYAALYNNVINVGEYNIIDIDNNNNKQIPLLC